MRLRVEGSFVTEGNLRKSPNLRGRSVDSPFHGVVCYTNSIGLQLITDLDALHDTNASAGLTSPELRFLCP